MEGGEVGAVIHLGSNPVYHFPGQLKYAQALRKIPLSVCLSETEDETAQLCTYILPAHHAFESWGDYQPRAGVLSLQQPVIAPLYQSRQREAVLLAWAAPETPFQETAYLEFVKSRWQREVYPASGAGADFTAFWFSALHDGVLVTAPPSASLARPASFPVSAPPTTPTDGYVALLTADPFMGDGSQAGNGWLQEIPHPISKVVWDNYASVSPSTAARLGTGDGDLVTITSTAGEVTAPVFVQAGQDDRTVTLALGYGRTVAGPVGSNVGVDAAALLGPEGLHGHRMVGGIRLAKAEGKHALVTTQEHHALDDAFVKEMAQKRDIIQEGTLEEFRRDPHFLHHEKKELFSIAKEVEYHGTKWAMAIDLNKCTGCNACVASCNVENNIPVVGKEQVAAGREMQWIRIDRYYAGTPDEPSLSHQPMLCQHCDNAPCENVCPVVATNHSPDGLNQMVYNRCVGTKYCSNNCPYKVRRFNFFNFRNNFADGYYLQEPVELVQNPEVTVRSRGVMEKCTFCVQRIMEERQHAAEQGRAVSGANVRTACQEACPASAIVFGDMSDPASAVSLHRAHPAGYTVLEEVNARPNVTYIARLRNTSEKPA
jgi:molybdopterin-containing oxidoreductase family iron-sulfur binding subunit